MGSNEREDQTTTQQHHHPPHISSLVVHTSGTNDGEVDRLAATGDVSRDRPSFSRSDRHNGSCLLHRYYIL
ncbi:hypothetical protein Bca4012_058063 [Brassica carinata]|uniref:Uncharacterized protein n=1 Tax=Brassica carinata TaxID=52824 RepID=A0A8X7TUR3_BRACI|nr:hypothetical protein Bca52824_084610 [Brassica carinata]